MTRSHHIAARLRELYISGHWIANTNYKEQLSSITRAQATQKVGTLNTIAALTYHINYYLAGLLNVFDGGKLEIRDKYSFDLPVFRSDEDWEKLVSEFLMNAERFADEVERMPDEKLDQPFVDEKYGTYLRNIEAVIEHGYYHLGQVSLVKKLIG